MNASYQAASAAAAGGHSPYEQSANESKKTGMILKQLERDSKDHALWQVHALCFT